MLLSGAGLIACGGSGGTNAPPGVATDIVVRSGNSQSQEKDSVFYQALKVRVRDGNGDGVASSSVVWSVRSGTGQLSHTTATTNSAGEDSIMVTAGGTVGQLIVQARSVEADDSVAFALNIAATPGARVRASNFAFTSGSNGSVNPAVDTISVGETVKWYLVAGTHSVQSQGSPAFTSSGTLSDLPYENLFFNAGTYQYNCGIHGNQMTGAIVVE
jgi:plastocyanin